MRERQREARDYMPAFIAAAWASIIGGMAYTASLLKNSGELYARWLEHAFAAGGAAAAVASIEAED